MAPAFEQSKDAIARLVKHFTTNREQYCASDYKEAHARQEFIDPLFVALGWDVANTQQAAPNYREVVVEDSLEIEGQKKAPDYVFRVGRERKFFAEAKKPGIDLKISAAPAYQLRRYAWTAKLPLSLLTDFDELAVYDCRVRPSEKDKASAARVNYLTFAEYPDRWREVWDVFSREAVWGGSFDQYALTGKGKRGTSTVDAEFLKEIEGWREALAHNLALRNPHLTVDELCDSVQRTIDRIIFLRMAEDRGIEEYGRLQRLIEKEGIYRQLTELFRHADRRYNSGLFDFSKSGDRLTPSLNLDDRTIKNVLVDLYFPQSPYEFSVLPVEILGNVYEQFLGKVIRLTTGHQAKVEEKPEVKKAGGVYYTPAYIVDYIVKNTVGVLVEGRSPAQLKGFRVLDPACGSGSFLLGAYQFLLDYYLRWYTANSPEKYKKVVYRLRGVGANSADWHLTSKEKKRILTEHIFGVDIDRQAAEVTKLSLLLKVLETESGVTLTQQLTLLPEEAKERALPNLDQNIKCGNSLIGPDYFSGRLMPDAENLRRVNPFDWAHEFPDIMRAGGFGCVIGNPPWGANIEKARRSYLVAKFPEVADFESSQYFLMQSMALLADRGLIGMIIPNTFALNVHAQKARQKVIDTLSITGMVDLSDVEVFEGPSVRSMIIFIGHEREADCRVIEFQKGALDWRVLQVIHSSVLRGSETWKEILTKVTPLSRLVTRLAKINPSIADYCDVRQGYIPYRTTTLTKRFGAAKAREILKNRSWHSNRREGPEYQRELQGVDVRRYSLNWSGVWVKYGEWVSTHLPISFFSGPRILIREITGRPPYVLHATYANEVFVHNPSVLAVQPRGNVSAKFVLGIINSSLMSVVFPFVAPKAKKGLFPKIIITDAKRLPMPRIDPEAAQDKARHDKMLMLVEQMLKLHRQKAAAKDSAEQEGLQRLIDSTDAQIDALVYELYGLTEEEIAVVEDAVHECTA